MKARIKTVALFLVILLTTLTLSDGVGAQTANPKVVKLSLDQAIDQALKHSSDLKLAQIAIDKAQIAVDKAENGKEQMEDAKDKLSSIGQWNDSFDNDLVMYYYPRQARYALTMAEKAKALKEKKVRLETQQLYYEALKAQMMRDVKKRSLDKAQEMVRLAYANQKAGVFSKLDVQNAETLAASAKAEYIAYENKFQIARMKLNKQLGLDLDTPLQLTTVLNYVPSNDLDVEKTIKDTVAESLDIYSANETASLAALKAQLADKYYTSNVFTNREAQTAKAEAEEKKEKTEVEVRLAVKQAYYTLKSAEERINVLKASINRAREGLRITTLRYQKGMATNAELLDARVSLEQVEAQYAEAIFDYNLARAQFTSRLFVLAGSDAQTTAATGTGGAGF
ncbi:TolC family protein [Carboxydocella sp. JDF658]|uniref:TolC family protein n=1 Tax=Carboxydocella sp. JDF658 TaxID=1926600 RepID=UPI0009ADD286|nr:TolC family protein [Carboxydocella sp. JDF658]GAW31258.1 hypothetical protein JDF658_10230 [Carboxydocella sp. JDF658]